MDDGCYFEVLHLTTFRTHLCLWAQNRHQTVVLVCADVDCGGQFLFLFLHSLASCRAELVNI